MRTAICFSGHLRSFEDVFSYLKETIIQPMNCDVFIHTWDNIGTPGNRNKGDGNGIVFKTNIETIQNLAKPISLLVEKENIHERFVKATNHINILPEEKCFIAGHVGFHVGMFYSIFKCNQLKSEYEDLYKFKYDRVIRFRPDIRMGTKFNLSMFPDNNILYVPQIGKYCELGLNDQVAIGSSKIIDTYCNIYSHIIKYYDEHVTVARPEMMISHHLTENKISVKEIDINYDIYRFDGSILRQDKLIGYNPGVRWK